MLNKFAAAACLTIIGTVGLITVPPAHAGWGPASKIHATDSILYVADDQKSRKVQKCRRLKQSGQDSRRCYNRKQKRRKKIEQKTRQQKNTFYRMHTPVQAPVHYVGNKTVGGGLIGAALGAFTGSRFGKGSGRTVTTIGGAVIGALIGGNIGKSMDQQDETQLSNALEYRKTGHQVQWRNATTGADYTVTPVRTYQMPNGTFCRDYTTWGWIDGFEEKLHGTACRQSDGSWQRR